jgi:hypothetical protein
MCTNSPSPPRRRIPAASAGSGLAPRWARVQTMQWQPLGGSIAHGHIGQQMWESFRKELREIAWLASLVAGLSIAGLTLAMVLVQP